MWNVDDVLVDVVGGLAVALGAKQANEVLRLPPGGRPVVRGQGVAEDVNWVGSASQH